MSTNAAEARTLGLLRATDPHHDESRSFDGRCEGCWRWRVQEGYRQPALRPAIAVGGAPLKAALDVGIRLALRAGRISEHDARIGRALAHIMAGGNVAARGLRERAASARSRTRSVPRPLRSAEDARTHRAYAEGGKAAAELKPPPAPPAAPHAQRGGRRRGSRIVPEGVGRGRREMRRRAR